VTSYDDRAREIVRDIRPYGEPWDWSYAEALTAAVLRAAAELAREEIRAAAQLVASKPVAGEWLRRDDDWMERRVNGEMVAWVSPRGAWCVTRVQDTKPILESACSTVPIAMLAADAWARDNAHLLDWTLPPAPVQPVAPRELTPAEVEECVPSAPRHDAGTGDEGVGDVIADMERMASLSPATALPWRANIAAVSRLAADVERLTASEEQARAAVLRAGRDPKWAAMYAWLDDNKDAAVKSLSDTTGAQEVEIASLRAQLSAASDRYARAVAEWDEVRGRLVGVIKEKDMRIAELERENEQEREWAAATADEKNDARG